MLYSMRHDLMLIVNRAAFSMLHAEKKEGRPLVMCVGEWADIVNRIRLHITKIDQAFPFLAYI